MKNIILLIFYWVFSVWCIVGSVSANIEFKDAKKKTIKNINGAKNVEVCCYEYDLSTLPNENIDSFIIGIPFRCNKNDHNPCLLNSIEALSTPKILGPANSDNECAHIGLGSSSQSVGWWSIFDKFEKIKLGYSWTKSDSSSLYEVCFYKSKLKSVEEMECPIHVGGFEVNFVDPNKDNIQRIISVPDVCGVNDDIKCHDFCRGGGDIMFDEYCYTQFKSEPGCVNIGPCEWVKCSECRQCLSLSNDVQIAEQCRQYNSNSLSLQCDLNENCLYIDKCYVEKNQRCFKCIGANSINHDEYCDNYKKYDECSGDNKCKAIDQCIHKYPLKSEGGFARRESFSFAGAVEKVDERLGMKGTITFADYIDTARIWLIKGCVPEYPRFGYTKFIFETEQLKISNINYQLNNLLSIMTFDLEFLAPECAPGQGYIVDIEVDDLSGYTYVIIDGEYSLFDFYQEADIEPLTEDTYILLGELDMTKTFEKYNTSKSCTTTRHSPGNIETVCNHINHKKNEDMYTINSTNELPLNYNEDEVIINENDTKAAEDMMSTPFYISDDVKDLPEKDWRDIDARNSTYAKLQQEFDDTVAEDIAMELIRKYAEANDKDEAWIIEMYNLYYDIVITPSPTIYQADEALIDLSEDDQIRMKDANQAIYEQKMDIMNNNNNYNNNNTRRRLLRSIMNRRRRLVNVEFGTDVSLTLFEKKLGKGKTSFARVSVKLSDKIQFHLKLTGTRVNYFRFSFLKEVRGHVMAGARKFSTLFWESATSVIDKKIPLYTDGCLSIPLIFRLYPGIGLEVRDGLQIYAMAEAAIGFEGGVECAGGMGTCQGFFKPIFGFRINWEVTNPWKAICTDKFGIAPFAQVRINIGLGCSIGVKGIAEIILNILQFDIIIRFQIDLIAHGTQSSAINSLKPKCEASDSNIDHELCPTDSSPYKTFRVLPLKFVFKIGFQFELFLKLEVMEDYGDATNKIHKGAKGRVDAFKKATGGRPLKVALLRAGFPVPYWVNLFSIKACPLYKNEFHRMLYGICCITGVMPAHCLKEYSTKQLKCGETIKGDFRDGCFYHEYQMDQSTFPQTGGLINVNVRVKSMHEVVSEDVGRKSKGGVRYDGFVDLLPEFDTFVVDAGLISDDGDRFSVSKYTGSGKKRSPTNMNWVKPIKVQFEMPKGTDHYIKIMDLAMLPYWYSVIADCRISPGSREDMLAPHPPYLEDKTHEKTKAGAEVWCPPGSYASEFDITADYGCHWMGDCAGITQVILRCSSFGNVADFMPDINGMSYTIKSPSDEQWESDIDDGEKSVATGMCEGFNAKFDGFRMRQDSGGDAQGLSELEFQCTDGTTRSQSTSDEEGSWSGWFSCAPNGCICGMKTEYEKGCGAFCDDSGVTYIQMYCCECDVPESGRRAPDLQPFDPSNTAGTATAPISYIERFISLRWIIGAVIVWVVSLLMCVTCFELFRKRKSITREYAKVGFESSADESQLSESQLSEPNL